MFNLPILGMENCPSLDEIRAISKELAYMDDPLNYFDVSSSSSSLGHPCPTNQWEKIRLSGSLVIHATGG